MIRNPTALLLLACLGACSGPSEMVVTVIGTNDVHGQLAAEDDRGGLVTLSGYVDAVRRAREADGGAVLLVDAGDMWQGTLESNLSEGAAMVSAYNALGYSAAAIGNHEFDFGPIGPAATPTATSDDPVGALKQRASEANFPLLAANLLDAKTGRRVDWPNVQPSVLLDMDGLKVGIVGVITSDALRMTIAANVRELRIAPLAVTVAEEARTLREAGAQLVIVTAHAGSECSAFDDPNDVSSCDPNGEIFQVAEALPAGLVDHINAGHVHEGIAHVVNGIAITSSYTRSRAFSRVDFTVDRRSGAILARRIYAPQPITADAIYEGQTVAPDPDVVLLAERATQLAKDLKHSSLGIRLETPFTLEGNPESALGNLFTDALLDSLDVDIAMHNVEGGLRRDLPAGELTYGQVYELSPFENSLIILDLSGAELRRVVAKQAHQQNRSVGFSGLRVVVSCDADDMRVEMQLADGTLLQDTDRVSVAVNEYMALGGDDILTEIMPTDGYPVDRSQPMVRDIFIQWLSETGGTISAEDFLTSVEPKWTRPEPLDPQCRLDD